jgi:hypothetical protein
MPSWTNHPCASLPKQDGRVIGGFANDDDRGLIFTDQKKQALFGVVSDLETITQQLRGNASDQPCIMLDCRSYEEFNSPPRFWGCIHCPCTTSDASSIDQAIADGAIQGNPPILLFCSDGSRAATAKHRLAELLFTDVLNCGDYRNAFRGRGIDLGWKVEPPPGAMECVHATTPQIAKSVADNHGFYHGDPDRFDEPAFYPSEIRPSHQAERREEHDR